MRPFFIRWTVTTVAVYVATPLAGLHFDGPGSLICAALVLGVVNAFLRPLVLLLSLPFIIVTLGIGILIVNAFMLMLVSKLVPGFHVGSFGHAFFGALIVSLVSWVLSAFEKAEDGRISVRMIRSADGMKYARGRVVK